MAADDMFARSSVVECVCVHAQDAPERLCLADSRISMTYGEAWSCIESFAGSLADRYERGAFAVIECDQSVEYLVAVLAIQYAGLVAVPLERNATDGRKAEVIGETEAVVFLGGAPCEGPGIDFIELRSVSDSSLGDGSAETELSVPQGQDLAEVLFSTGTTGKSKGIMLSHRNNMAIAENVICGLDMPADNVEIIPMPTSHSHGLRRTYSNLVNGSAVVFCDGVVAIKRMFNLMDEHGVNAMDLSPSMLSIIFKLSKDRLGEYADVLSYVQLGSAPLAEEDKTNLARLLPRTRLYNFYGSTEAGCSCLLDFGSMSGKKNCIGRPAVNARFVMVDDERNPIESSPDNMGLIASAGDINMMGYFNAPELTAQTMSDGFIYTSDLGYIDDEGLVYMLGRKDDVINFGGVKIAPEEIESAVNKSPLVKECALIPVDDPISGQVPKLFVVLEDDIDYDAKEFRKFLQSVVDANKQPQSVELLDSIPRTSNGKIRRKELMHG